MVLLTPTEGKQIKTKSQVRSYWWNGLLWACSVPGIAVWYKRNKNVAFVYDLLREASLKHLSLLAGWQWVSHLFIYSLSDRTICYFGSPAATFPSCLHPRFPWKLSRPSPYGTFCGALSLDTLDRGFDSHLANCTVFAGHRDWPGDGHVTHAEPMRCKEAKMDLSEAGTGFMTDEPWGSGTLGLHEQFASRWILRREPMHGEDQSQAGDRAPVLASWSLWTQLCWTWAGIFIRMQTKLL